MNLDVVKVEIDQTKVARFRKCSYAAKETRYRNFQTICSSKK